MDCELTSVVSYSVDAFRQVCVFYGKAAAAAGFHEVLYATETPNKQSQAAAACANSPNCSTEADA